MAFKYYMLDEDKNVVEAANQSEWSDFMASDNKIVQQDHGRMFWASTVMLSIDHSFGGSRPILFESMVFPNDNSYHELYCSRYCTYDQALKGHANALAYAKVLDSYVGKSWRRVKKEMQRLDFYKSYNQQRFRYLYGKAQHRGNCSNEQ